MIYRFTIISGEDDNFLREIEIESDKTFLDLHQAIQHSVHYDPKQLASFFLCDKNWQKEHEITLFEMEDSEEETSKTVMDVSLLSEFITEARQKILYIFDFFSERGFFIEMVHAFNNHPGRSYPYILKSEGDPPPQLLIDNDFITDADLNEELWDENELDGFSIENFDDDTVN
jgi:hypothetical protein